MRMKAQRHGLFLVFDGTDGSGKSTQLQLLARRLRRNGRRVAVVDFPQYRTTFFGRFIRRLLDGEFGPMGSLNPYLTSLAYAGDRWQARRAIEALLEAGTIVLADRYTSANMIHQGAKFVSARQRAAFVRWLKTLEYAVFRIPRPDAVYFFDVPPTVSRQLVAGRRRRPDTAERDRWHQDAAYRTARWLAAHERGWHRFPCVAKGVLRTPSAIAEDVWQKVRAILP